MTGTIKTLSATKQKGFGFIRGEDGNEYFVHRSACTRGLDFESLSEGERVSFDVEQGQKGPRAANVQRS